MRKFLFLTVLAVFLSVPAFAALQISVSGGYSYSNLDNLKSYWEKAKVDAEAYTTTSNADWKGYSNGVFGNLDVNINIDKSILVGARTGIQYIFPSTYSGFRVINIPPLTWVYTETSIENYLIPVMAGVNLYMPMGTDSAIAINAAAYAGWGLAYCAQKTKYNNSEALLALYGGNGFVADLTASVEVKILAFLSASLNGGYRFAKMTDFKNVKSVSANVPGYGMYNIPTNDPFNDGNGKPVDVDFSGINIGAGLNLRF